MCTGEEQTGSPGEVMDGPVTGPALLSKLVWYCWEGGEEGERGGAGASVFYNLGAMNYCKVVMVIVMRLAICLMCKKLVISALWILCRQFRL